MGCPGLAEQLWGRGPGGGTGGTQRPALEKLGQGWGQVGDSAQSRFPATWAQGAVHVCVYTCVTAPVCAPLSLVPFPCPQSLLHGHSPHPPSLALCPLPPALVPLSLSLSPVPPPQAMPPPRSPQQDHRMIFPPPDLSRGLESSCCGG